MSIHCKRPLAINALMLPCVTILLSGCVTTQGTLSLPYKGAATTSGTAFTVVNEGVGDGSDAIAGVTAASRASGVHGSGAAYGGRFVAGGVIGTGVYGEASNTSGERNYGGYFKASGKAGQGVYAEAPNTGVFGTATDPTGGNIGGSFEARGNSGRAVVGVASNEGDEVRNVGGHFVAKGQHGMGIYAEGGREGRAADFKGTVRVGSRSTADVVITLGDDGKLRTKVLEITGGSDLSEKFQIRTETSVSPTAGMLVIIDPDNPGKLLVSNQAYDRRIAGIISGAGGVASGLTMTQSNSTADGEHAVALIGRVYCLADTSNGSIQPGDLLTTSEIPGYAMKVTDHIRANGAVLGKAMTRLESGQGLVLVLVNLQ